MKTQQLLTAVLLALRRDKNQWRRKLKKNTRKIVSLIYSDKYFQLIGQEFNSQTGTTQIYIR